MQEKDVKNNRLKLLNNPHMKSMAHEQFAKMAQKKESQISETIILSKLNLTTHFAKIGFSCRITELLTEYLVKAVTKMSFKEYYKFLVEGLLSNLYKVQKQICFSVFSGCKERLHLSELFGFFDDLAWRVLLNDLLAMHEMLSSKLKNKESKMNDKRVKTRAEIQKELFKRLEYLKKLQQKREHSYLVFEPQLNENSPSEENLLNNGTSDDLNLIIAEKDAYLTFEEFCEIKFENYVPNLLFFVAFLICGEDLLDYYSEQIGIPIFRFLKLQNGGKYEFSFERLSTNRLESTIKRQNKVLITKLQHAKPNANIQTMKIAMDLFQKIKSSTIQKESGLELENEWNNTGISKEQFLKSDVTFFFIIFRLSYLANTFHNLQKDYLQF